MKKHYLLLPLACLVMNYSTAGEQRSGLSVTPSYSTAITATAVRDIWLSRLPYLTPLTHTTESFIAAGDRLREQRDQLRAEQDAAAEQQLQWHLYNLSKTSQG